MSVEGPILNAQYKYISKKKSPKSKLTCILDGQVNGLTFLY